MQLLVAVGGMSRLNSVLGACFNEQGKDAEIAAFERGDEPVGETFDNYSGRKVSAVAGLMAVASFSGAEAQQGPLPPVTVDAPVTRPRPAASKPSPTRFARALPCDAPRADTDCASRAGAVSQRRRPERRPQPLCGSGGTLQGRSCPGVGKISRAAVEYAEDDHGAEQGSAGRQERHVA